MKKKTNKLYQAKIEIGPLEKQFNTTHDPEKAGDKGDTKRLKHSKKDDGLNNKKIF